MNWIIFVIPLLFVTILPAFADFHSEMIQFMPDVDGFDENWKYTQVQGFKNLELDWSEKTPDGLIQRFVLTDQVDETEMINTVSIYEFADKKTSGAIYEEYVTTLTDNDYPEAPVETSLQENCFATMVNQGQDNEKTSVACKNSQYVIISTSQQTGDVFQQDKQLTTLVAANGFANIIYQNIEDLQSTEIPEWIKNNAGWWAEGQIDDNSFIQGIQYMIKEGILEIPNTSGLIKQTQSNEIPEWIKTNAGWWAEGKISDSDFVKGIQYMIKEGIIQIYSI